MTYSANERPPRHLSLVETGSIGPECGDVDLIHDNPELVLVTSDGVLCNVSPAVARLLASLNRAKDGCENIDPRVDETSKSSHLRLISGGISYREGRRERPGYWHQNSRAPQSVRRPKLRVVENELD